MDEKRIRNSWFKNHKAKYEIISDSLRILEWKKPDSLTMGVRYVMDGRNLYITGDLYSAIFTFTSEAKLSTLSGYNLSYFKEKLITSEMPDEVFNRQLAKEELEEWFNDNADMEDEDTKELFEILTDRMGECSIAEDWMNIVNDNYEEISNLDRFYADWIYHIGLETSVYIKAYLIGLQMAYEQIKNN